MNGNLDFDHYFSRMDTRLADMWGNIMRTSPMASCVLQGKTTRELYAIYLVETYHYTSHNARNQALVATRPDVRNPIYAKFCMTHASDEYGDEQMALHDLGSLGFSKEASSIPAALPETEALIGYLYWISMTGNPLRRLGYSYWAESCYGYIAPLLQKIKTTLNLAPAQMTFFLAHSEIDQAHFEEVKSAIRRNCKQEADLLDIEQVMEQSLVLTARVMDAALSAHQEFGRKPTRRYDFLTPQIQSM